MLPLAHSGTLPLAHTETQTPSTLSNLKRSLHSRLVDLQQPSKEALKSYLTNDGLEALPEEVSGNAIVLLCESIMKATLPGFSSKGLSIEEGESLLERSVKLAVEARDSFWNSVKRNPGNRYKRALDAASIGSYGAYLVDGSEYSGCYGPYVNLKKLKDFHRCRLQVLVEAGLDLLAFETIPNKLEAQVFLFFVCFFLFLISMFHRSIP
ncbi:homocysteine S-methyltransferase 1-like [Cajanus cajan]|uniref:homocysteine S-methyltransferase 1-like n=1 Tax=Cajanus cajan TaxID=3821 RepID=UPI0010FB2E7E|nr:homocysteine S-methyltransferase 1-like [Cajanus cajan]